MSRRIIHLISILMFLFLVSCNKETDRPMQSDCTIEADSLQTSSKSAAYKALINKYTRQGLPGIVLSVNDSTGIFNGASGQADIKNDISMQACHVQDFSGVIQIFLATAVFRLQEKGMISLDDPVDKYIPKATLKKIGNGSSPLKIRNLMNHTAGLYDFTTDREFLLDLIQEPEKERTAEDLLRFVNNKNSMFPFRPADSAGFSNTSYLLLSMAVESATGVPAASIIQQEVLLPAGLTQTYILPQIQIPDGLKAQGYFDLYGNNNLHNLSMWNTGFGNGFNGIYSTLTDMQRFLQVLFIEKSLLSDASLSTMLTFEPDIEDGKQMGTGCFRDFVDATNPNLPFSWGYRGRGLSSTAEIHYLPETGTTLIFAINYGTLLSSGLRYKFLSFRTELIAIARQK